MGQNDFDRRIDEACEAVKARSGRGSISATDRADIVGAALTEVYAAMPEHEADMLVFKSENWGAVSVGRGLAIQRRIILSLMNGKHGGGPET